MFVAAYQPALAGLVMGVFPGSCAIIFVLYRCNVVSRESKKFDDLVKNQANHVSQLVTNDPSAYVQWVSLLLLERWDKLNKEIIILLWLGPSNCNRSLSFFCHFRILENTGEYGKKWMAEKMELRPQNGLWKQHTLQVLSICSIMHLDNLKYFG